MSYSVESDMKPNKHLVAQTVKSACNAGDPGSVPGSGRSPGERNGYPLQYSCLENSVDRGAWWATVHGVAELGTTEGLTLLLHTWSFIPFTVTGIRRGKRKREGSET